MVLRSCWVPMTHTNSTRKRHVFSHPPMQWALFIAIENRTVFMFLKGRRLSSKHKTKSLKGKTTKISWNPTAEDSSSCLVKSTVCGLFSKNMILYFGPCTIICITIILTLYYSTKNLLNGVWFEGRKMSILNYFLLYFYFWAYYFIGIDIK